MSDTAPHRPPRVPLPQNSLSIHTVHVAPRNKSTADLPYLYISTAIAFPNAVRFSPQPRLVNPSYPLCLYPHPHPPPSIPNQNHTKYRNYFQSEQTTMMMHQKPTVCVPPWSSLFDDPSAVGPFSGVSADGSLLVALQRYQNGGGGDGCEPYDYDDSDNDDLPDSAIDTFSCDEFRMYEFKVRRCARGRSHDWTECPFAHPGEKARRRDPRKYHYSGTACPDFRKGCCKRGDACDMAHGVFECWLHPARYRTQPCKDGTACRRRVCFFAHTPDQLRVLPQSPKTPLDSYDGSPLRQQQLMFAAAASSQSPPMSPTGERGGEGLSPPMSPEAAAVLASLRKLQLGKVKSGRGFGLGFGSPRGLGGCGGFRAGFCSLPTTPTRAVGCFGGGCAEECVERVESGRALRAKMYERLSKESSGGGMEKQEPAAQTGSGPDVGWVSELLM